MINPLTTNQFMQVPQQARGAYGVSPVGLLQTAAVAQQQQMMQQQVAMQPRSFVNQGIGTSLNPMTQNVIASTLNFAPIRTARSTNTNSLLGGSGSSPLMGMITELLKKLLQKMIGSMLGGRNEGNSTTKNDQGHNHTHANGNAGTVNDVEPDNTTNAPNAADSGNAGTVNDAGDSTRPAAAEIDEDLDFRDLTNAERTEAGLSDYDRAVLHTWGRQMISEGKQNGAILNTIVQQAESGQRDGTVKINQVELDLANKLIASDKEKYGGTTGKALDEEFFRVYAKVSGKSIDDIRAKYGNKDPEFANGQTAKLPNVVLDSAEWQSQVEAKTGLNEFETTALRLWGHEPLLNGGKIDGSSLAYTLNSDNALDRGMNKAHVRNLLEADLAIDGVVNGDSMNIAFDGLLDKVYNGGEGTSATKVKNEAISLAQKAGQTVKEVTQNVKTGVKDALFDVAAHMKEKPLESAAIAGGAITAAAVCPFLGGMVAGAVGVTKGAQMLNKDGGSAAAA